MALFVAKVRPFILFDCLRGLSFNPLFILHPQYRYQRLNVQQTKTVPVERHAYRRNVRIPVRPYHHVLPMLSAQFITPFPWEQCLAPVCQVLLAKAMSAVKKYVSNSKEFYEKRLYFELIFSPHPTVIPEPVGCSSDDECSSNEACYNRNCQNPCVNNNPCSSNAACFVDNHKANCRCPAGFTGDPFRRCVQSKSHSNFALIGHRNSYFKPPLFFWS